MCVYLSISIPPEHIAVKRRYSRRYPFLLHLDVTIHLVLTATNCTWPSSYRSLILLSPSEPSSDGFDYKVCLLERGSHISNASATVFPGGNLDPVDYEAARLYSGESSDAANEDNLPMQALRACAVRETFEEVGVLLSNSEYTTPPKGSEYKAWRKELSTNPSFFLEIYPRLKTSDSKPKPPLDELLQ